MSVPRIVLLLVVVLAPVQALPARTSLYVGEAVVDGPRAPDRAPLLDALDQVLVRVTGRVGEDMIARLGVDRARAEGLALGRQLREVERPVADGEVRERRLRVEFDAAGIDALLDQAGLARWGSERPEMLVWMVEEGPAGARYLEPDGELRHALDAAAFRFGLELTRPILDARDRLEVTPADVRGGFTGVAGPARERYGADAVVMLDLREQAGFWTGRWAWRLGEREQTFQRSGARPAEVVELGLGRIAAALAARFAVRPDAEVDRVVRVSGITAPVHMTEVAGFLGGLTGVRSVRLFEGRGDALRFRVRSTTDGLRQRIELTGPLEFVRHDLASGELHYRLVW